MRINRGRIWIPLGITGLVLLIAAGIGLTWMSRLPAVGNQVLKIVKSTALNVTFFSPQNLSEVPADISLPVLVQVDGPGRLAGVHLWANGEWIGSLPAPYPVVSAQATHYFRWQPGKRGSYTLVAQAEDSAGRLFSSAPLFVTAGSPVGNITSQFSLQGETLLVLAKRVNLPVAQLQALNPGLDPLKPLTANTPVRLSPPFDPAKPPVQPPAGLLILGQPQMPVLAPGTSGGSAVIWGPIMFDLAAPDKASADLKGRFLPKNLLDLAAARDFSKSSASPKTPISIAELAPRMMPDDPLAKFTFWWKANLAPVAAPPRSSAVVAKPGVDCSTEIEWVPIALNLDGYFIYRAREGSDTFERVATLSAVSGEPVLTAFRDLKQYGQTTYQVAAFNSAGESYSNPVTIDFDKALCLAPDEESGADLVVTGQVEYNEDGTLKLPLGASLAYLYLSTDGSNWERIPEQGKFLKWTGSFNVNEYVDQLIEKNPATSLHLTIEVWGWVGSQVQLLGTIERNIRRSVLVVCSKGVGQCGALGPGSGWVTELELPDTIPFPKDIEYEFAWNTYNTANPHSVQLFVDGAMDIMNTGQVKSNLGRISVFEMPWNGAQDQKFTRSPAWYFADPAEKFQMGDWQYGNFTSNFFLYKTNPGTPFVMTFQVLPETNPAGKGSKSNRVTLRYRNDKPAPPPATLASELPSILDVKLINYTAPILPHAEVWGCVIILNTTYEPYGEPYGPSLNGMDFMVDSKNCWDPLSATCNNKKKGVLFGIGQKVCPSEYVPPPDWKVLVNGIQGMIESGINWMNNAMNTVKSTVVNAVANQLPFCNQTCRDLMMAGLNYGITALTGIPPSIPNFTELADQGIAYAAKMAAKELGDTYCPAGMCEDLIKDTLQSQYDEITSKAPAPGCVGAEEAHARGKEPLCLPAGVKWRTAVNAAYQPGTLQLQVTRRADSAGAKLGPADAKKYAVEFGGVGYNTSRIGSWFANCGFVENQTGPDIGYTDGGGGYQNLRQINDQLVGNLYNPKTFEIPWLQPGASITFPIQLERALFLRPWHDTDWHDRDWGVDKGLAICGDDWPYLFYDGVSFLIALEICQNSQGLRVACGAKDSLTITNPSASAIQMEPPVAQPVNP